MKSIIASLGLISLALAGPIDKRDRATSVVITTEWTTTTVFVDAPTGGAFAEGKKPAPAPPVVSAPAAPAPEVPAPVPASVPASAPAPSVPASAPVIAAPSPDPVPAPAFTPPVDVPKPQVAAPSPPAAPVAPAIPAAVSNVITSGKGDATFYDVSVGLGSCGTQSTNSDNVVAIATANMANGVNPNKNPLCGKTITINYNGASHTGVVYDTCAGCKAGDIDLSPEFFKTVFPNGDGRVPGVSWSIS